MKYLLCCLSISLYFSMYSNLFAAEEASPQTEVQQAIDQCLTFFLKHQDQSGAWTMTGNPDSCNGLGSNLAYTNNEGSIALTSLVLELFYRNGHLHANRGPHRKSLQAGVAWLLKQQDTTGSFDRRNYAHAMATHTLVLLHSEDRNLRKPLSLAIKSLLERQAESGGWDYSKANDRRNDMSVSSWAAMVLYSAEQQKLHLSGADDSLRNCIEEAWKHINNGPVAPDSAADFPYTYSSDNAARKLHGGRSYLGISLCHSLGVKPDSDLMQSLATAVLQAAHEESSKQQLLAWPCDLYATYHATHGIMAIKQHQETWANIVTPVLLRAQQQASDVADTACLTGSWSAEGMRFHGSDAGRMLVTALAGLTLTLIQQTNS